MLSLVLPMLGLALAEESTALKMCATKVGKLPDSMESAKRAVVRIETMAGSGSGVFVSPDGFVLTAAHVVGTAPTVKVVLADKSTIDGEVVRVSAGEDVALVRTSLKSAPCAPLGASRVAEGSDLYVLGSPVGMASVTRGVVSAYRESEGRVFLQTDASINPGNSGGPMFAGDGSVAAVVSFKAVGAGIEGMGFGLAAEGVSSALGIQLGEATAAEFPVRMSAGAAAGPAVPAGPEITGRPATPVQARPKMTWCEKWAKEEKDPFTGAAALRAQQPGGGAGGYAFSVDGGKPVLAWPTFLSVIGIGPGDDWSAVTMSMAFQDGTVMSVRSARSSMGTIPYSGPFVKYEYELDRASLEVFGSTRLKAIKWTFPSGRTATQPINPESGFTEDLQLLGACLAKQLKPPAE